MLPNILKQCYQFFGSNICPSRFPVTPADGKSNSSNLKNQQDCEFQQQFEPLKTTKSNVYSNGKHKTIHSYTNAKVLKENISSELINDLICDNITFKKELESMNKQCEEINSRLRSITGSCDIMVVDIAKDSKSVQTSKRKDNNKLP